LLLTVAELVGGAEVARAWLRTSQKDANQDHFEGFLNQLLPGGEPERRAASSDEPPRTFKRLKKCASSSAVDLDD